MSLFRTAELQGRNSIEKLLDMAKLAIEKRDLSAHFFKLAA
jgi:hypothetical protein